MQPIHELLSRIRWDPDYSQADFEVGYFDRLEQRIVRIPLREVYFPEDEHFVFTLTDADGVTHHVPYHRVREVYRNGELVWQRSVATNHREVKP